MACRDRAITCAVPAGRQDDVWSAGRCQDYEEEGGQVIDPGNPMPDLCVDSSGLDRWADAGAGADAGDSDGPSTDVRAPTAGMTRCSSQCFMVMRCSQRSFEAWRGSAGGRRRECAYAMPYCVVTEAAFSQVAASGVPGSANIERGAVPAGSGGCFLEAIIL